MIMVSDSWMTNQFGYPVFKLDDSDSVSGELTGLPTVGPAFCYAKVPTNDVSRLQHLCSLGFRVVDVHVVFECHAGNETSGSESFEISTDRHEPREDILSIAERSFTFDRFHLDPAIPVGVGDRIKRNWIGSYLDRKRGERLHVAWEGNQPVGFLAELEVVEHDVRIRVIDLIATAKSHRGRGVGQTLISGFFRMNSGDCDLFRVGTQVANVPSIRLYERRGFLHSHSAYVLHGHFEDGRPRA